MVPALPLAARDRPHLALAAWLEPLGLLALVAFAFLPFSDAAFAGSDSLTLVETSRLRSLADLANLVARPVMAGTEFLVSMVEARWISGNGGSHSMESGSKAQQELQKIEQQIARLESEFAELRTAGERMGYAHVEAGPLVRSSYHAERTVAR